ncbi:MAG: AraC family transcriptional regulator [Clostridiales bacterium]|nr:AraC family transcriptional regulator [Clostridiales bacterium]
MDFNYIINTETDKTKYPIYFTTVSSRHRQENIYRKMGSATHQILLISEGNGRVSCNGKTFPLYRGCAFYTAPNVPCSYVSDNGMTSAFLTVNGISAKMLEENFSENGFLYRNDVDTEKLLSFLNNFIYEYTNSATQARTSALAYSFFLDFFTESNSKNLDYLEKIYRYITSHFASALKLEDLAKISCVSVSKLCHDFKKRYSVSIFEYIVSLRLSYAYELLSNSPNVAIQFVAKNCGFEDLGYFCKAYKKQYGITPSQTKKH